MMGNYGCSYRMHTDISFYGEVLYEILQLKAEVGLRRFLVRLNIHDTALRHTVEHSDYVYNEKRSSSAT